LHNAEFGDHRTPEQWMWEYKGNTSDQSVFAVMKDSGKVVGTQGMIPIYLNIGGHRYLSGKSENTLLDVRYRGRGLSSVLYRSALSMCESKRMCCVWGFTPVASAVNLLRSMGFTIYPNAVCQLTLILKMPDWQFMSSILHSRSNLVTRIARCLGVVLLYLYSRTFICTNVCVGATFSLEEQVRTQIDIERIYERLREKVSDLIHIAQDEEYLSWRIANNPHHGYVTYFAYEGALLKGYCYVAFPNKREAYISDFTFEDYRTGEFLLTRILDTLHKRRSTSVSFAGNANNELSRNAFALLKKHGFVKVFSESFVLKQMSTDSPSFLTNIANWYLNGLWTEGYTW
jgi:GNAT superfamily N-acetyltransferase